MAPDRVMLYRWAAMPNEVVSPTLERRLISGEKAMLAYVSLKQGGLVPTHQHFHEQFTYVLNGALRFRIGKGGAEETVVRTGEVLHLPSQVWHEAEILEDSIVLDVFSPPREDWLEKTDTYLRRCR